MNEYDSLTMKKVVELSNRANAVHSPNSRAFGIFLKLQEELGEFATAVNIPEKCDEHYTGEAADVMLAFIDFYLTLKKIDGVEPNEAILQLNEQIINKSGKWEKHVTKLESLIAT